jgi:hypothetical protein
MFMMRMLLGVMFLSSCMHPLTTYNRHVSYDLDDQELEKIQVFLSGRVTLERRAQSNSAVVDAARVRIARDRLTEVLILKKGLPGVIVASDLISGTDLSFCGAAPPDEREACERRLIYGSTSGQATASARQRDAVCVSFDPQRPQDCLLFSAITDAAPRSRPHWPQHATREPYRIETLPVADRADDAPETYRVSYAGHWWTLRFDPDYSQRPYLRFQVDDMARTLREKRHLGGRTIEP